jgi:hypothetical protein
MDDTPNSVETLASIDDFVALLRDEIGLLVTAEDVHRGFDDVPGWDSVHLLHLATVLADRTGRTFSLADLLSVTSLEGVYSLAVGS